MPMAAIFLISCYESSVADFDREARCANALPPHDNMLRWRNLFTKQVSAELIYFENSRPERHAYCFAYAYVLFTGFTLPELMERRLGAGFAANIATIILSE